MPTRVGTVASAQTCADCLLFLGRSVRASRLGPALGGAALASAHSLSLVNNQDANLDFMHNKAGPNNSRPEAATSGAESERIVRLTCDKNQMFLAAKCT